MEHICVFGASVNIFFFFYPYFMCTSLLSIYLALASLMTHQGPGTEQRACPGKEAAGVVLRQCEEQLEGTVGVEGGSVLCRHKKKNQIQFGLF